MVSEVWTLEKMAANFRDIGAEYYSRRLSVDKRDG
jgi:hypothetical protein